MKIFDLTVLFFVGLMGLVSLPANAEKKENFQLAFSEPLGKKYIFEHYQYENAIESRVVIKDKKSGKTLIEKRDKIWLLHAVKLLNIPKRKSPVVAVTWSVGANGSTLWILGAEKKDKVPIKSFTFNGDYSIEIGKSALTVVIPDILDNGAPVKRKHRIEL